MWIFILQPNAGEYCLLPPYWFVYWLNICYPISILILTLLCNALQAGWELCCPFLCVVSSQCVCTTREDNKEQIFFWGILKQWWQVIKRTETLRSGVHVQSRQWQSLCFQSQYPDTTGDVLNLSCVNLTLEALYCERVPLVEFVLI